MGTEHWKYTDLRNLCSIKTGKRDVNHGNPNGIYQFFTCAQQPTRIDFFEFEGEALLIAGNGFFNIKHYIGKFNAYQRTYVLQDFKIDPKFLYYYIDFSLDYLTKDNRGTTVKYIRLPDLQNHPVPTPPQTEQLQIVAKLDSILPKVRKAKERLEKIPVLLKKFRQSILSAACSGHLTEGWRNTAEQDYRRTKVRDLVISIKYGTSAKCAKEPIGLPILRIPNIQSGYVDSSDLKYAELDKSEKNKLQLIEGDLLLVRSNGSVDLVGRSAIVTQKETHYGYAGYLMRLRVDKNKVCPEFLNYCFQSYDMRLQIQLPARSTTGVHNINTTEVKNLELNLPPLDEQQEIVRTINKLFALADSLETRYWVAVAHVNKIEQSILAKAFRGELIEPDLDFSLTEKLDECVLKT